VSIAGVAVIDVLPGVDRRRLEQLQAIHTGYFAGHEHVLAEMEQAWAEGGFDPDIVVHQWLLLHDGDPSGEFIFHTNLRRGIVVRHFLAMDASVRKELAKGWAGDLIIAAQRQSERDARDRGVEILALMSEIAPDEPRLLAHWRDLGHVSVPSIDYREPYHGKDWPDFGEPRFFAMTPNVKLTEAGHRRPLGEVMHAAVSAFLLDHYLLPSDDPTVAGILERASQVQREDLIGN
jgi:hypothetical protein